MFQSFYFAPLFRLSQLNVHYVYFSWIKMNKGLPYALIDERMKWSGRCKLKLRKRQKQGKQMRVLFLLVLKYTTHEGTTGSIDSTQSERIKGVRQRQRSKWVKRNACFCPNSTAHTIRFAHFPNSTVALCSIASFAITWLIPDVVVLLSTKERVTLYIKVPASYIYIGTYDIWYIYIYTQTYRHVCVCVRTMRS